MTSVIPVPVACEPCETDAMVVWHGRPAIVNEVVTRLEESIPDLLRAVVETLGDDLPAYEAVPQDDLQTSTRRTLGMVINAIRVGEPVVQAEAVDMAMIRRRREQGVMPDAMVQSSRRVAAVVLEHVQTHAHDMGLSDHEVLALTNLVWAVTDVMGVRVSEAYRAIDLDMAMHDIARRNQFLCDIVESRLTPVEVEVEARVLGLDPLGRFRAIYLRPLAEMGDEAIEQVRVAVVAEVGAFGGSSLVGIHDGTCLGLLSARALPRLRGLDVVAGLGPELDLAHVEMSMTSARAICAAAVRRGTPGVFELPDVTWRVAVSQQPSVTEILRQRYLVPVLGEGDTRDTVKTLRAYLDADRHVQRAADALCIHPNTLRYRLARFEELTGQSLSSTEVVIELSWLLEAM